MLFNLLKAFTRHRTWYFVFSNTRGHCIRLFIVAIILQYAVVAKSLILMSVAVYRNFPRLHTCACVTVVIVAAAVVAFFQKHVSLCPRSNSKFRHRCI